MNKEKKQNYISEMTTQLDNSQAVIVAIPKIIKPKPLCAMTLPHSDPRTFLIRSPVILTGYENGLILVKISLQAPKTTQTDKQIPIGAIRLDPF